ncbi:TPA: hypothetical protein ACG0A4_003455 [Enterobacter hormaechei subsp. steigerwaltii]|mgnify:CR=1 FL=1|uniref:hypothetical protein n=1 Tax=Enterobacter hormaechei TaxID=158836 RepID=UPI00079A6ED3|nr:hypothetical protein [Enterobacter hormaechei]CZY25325.1 Uncharacterised protein [Enterobacter hormaechei]
MSLLKDIQIFIADNPGLTNKQIAASMPQYDVHAVQRGVCHLVKLNRATRQHNGKCYQYWDAEPVTIIKDLLSGGDKARDNAVEWLKKQGVTL